MADNMDYIYAPPPPPRAKNNKLAKKKKPNCSSNGAQPVKQEANFFDLPTYLPNQIPLKVEEKEDEKVSGDEEEEQKSEEIIAGTNIRLNTDEDIAKWIEERKKNWPSRKRMEEKKIIHDQKVVTKTDESQSKKRRLDDTRICKFHSNGFCKNGSQCKNLHEAKIPQRYGLDRDDSLYNKLMKKEYELENMKILDFLEYLNQNGLVTSI